MTPSFFLIIVMSAWSGQTQSVAPFQTMEECRTALAETKIAASSGNAAAAYCSPEAPTWYKYQHGLKQ